MCVPQVMKSDTRYIGLITTFDPLVIHLTIINGTSFLACNHKIRYLDTELQVSTSPAIAVYDVFPICLWS